MWTRDLSEAYKETLICIVLYLFISSVLVRNPPRKASDQGPIAHLHETMLGVIEGRGGGPGPRLANSRRKPRRTVLIVDDDPSVLRAVARLVRADGFKALTFERPGLLLSADIPKSDACLVFDVYLPEMNGVQLYETLTAEGCRLPVILITGRNDTQTRRLVERLKAVEVLFKPFDDSVFLQVISRAFGVFT